MITRIARLFLVVGFLGFVFASAATAQSCRLAGIDPDAFDSGTLLLRTSVGWTVFDPTRDLKNFDRRYFSFAYIVKVGDLDRSGAVVIKTAEQLPVAEARPINDKVLLVRRPGTADVCPHNPRLIWAPAVASYVSNQAYEAYHNYGSLDSPDYIRHERDFKRFHTQYRSLRLNRCIATDDAEYHAPSNLSQFSFSPAVVQGDTIGLVGVARAAVFGFFSPGRALAQTSEANLRTEIRHYRTTSGSACVHMTLALSQRSFVRINDLENRPIIPLIQREREWKP